MVSNLHGYFGKILLVQQMPGAAKSEVASTLGVNPFFVEEYMIAAKNYSPGDMERAFNQIKLLDLKLKGVHRGCYRW